MQDVRLSGVDRMSKYHTPKGMWYFDLEHAPDSIRGELSLFSQEIAPFTFVSNASAKTRDKLWEDIINIDGISAVLR